VFSYDSALKSGTQGEAIYHILSQDAIEKRKKFAVEHYRKGKEQFEEKRLQFLHVHQNIRIILQKSK
jgi:tRNA(Ser,Leu) C12 N-acetylase TAN1